MNGALVLPSEMQRFLGVPCFKNCVAVPLEDGLSHCSNNLVILDEQNRFGPSNAFRTSRGRLGRLYFILNLRQVDSKRGSLAHLTGEVDIATALFNNPIGRG